MSKETQAIKERIAAKIEAELLHRMNKIQKLDWQTSKTPQTGRIAQISDEGCGYWATLPDGMTLQDAADAFGVGYDYNDYVGEISCDAQLIVDGAEVDSLQFTLDSRE